MKTTRCPTCNTVFRVSAEQLDARQGRVRCGQCAHVFNALESLVEDPEALAPTASPVYASSHRLREAFAEKPAVVESRRRERLPPRNTPAEPAPLPPPKIEETFSQPISPEAMRDELPPHAPLAATWMEEEATPEAPSAPRNLGWLWGMGIGLLLVGAVGQGAYVFRSELTMSYPNLRPQFVDWCQSLACDMPLPKKADLIGIEASELRPSPQGKNLLQLVATLRNRAGFPQDWPHLELTLTDTDDKPLVRRVFSPKEFLPAKVDGAAGFPAGGDMALSLNLDPSTLTAAGYRLYVFYP